jgi:lysozyme family protein
MVDLNALIRANADRWSKAKLTREANSPARQRWPSPTRAGISPSREQAGMPDIAWVFIAVSHYRESSQDFSKSLAQGDPWNRVSTHVPKGRGPFKSFEDAAVDALGEVLALRCPLKDWSIGGMLTNLERFNGLGYASAAREMPMPSPYVWSRDQSAEEGQVRRGRRVRPGQG